MSFITNQPVVIDNPSALIILPRAPALLRRESPANLNPKCCFLHCGLEEERVSSVRAGKSGANDDVIVVGERANEMRGLLKLSYAMEHGRVQDWGHMESLWHHAYAGLGVAPEDIVSSFNVENQIRLWKDYRFAMPHAIQRINLAGRDVTDYLEVLLRRAGDGYDFHTTAEHQIVRNIKETACYVAEDPAKEEYKIDSDGRSARLVEYKLPDGSVMNIGAEAFRAPELLFHPELAGYEYAGVHQCVANAVHRADMDLRRNLYSNIVLAGGSTLFPGFGKRLLNEVIDLAPKDIKIKISAPQERQDLIIISQTSTWIGGSILASLTTFQSINQTHSLVLKMWVSRAEYKEQGSVVLHRKCF